MREVVHRLLPRMCVFCGLFEARKGICSYCDDVLPRNDNFCCRCGQPLDAPATCDTPCGACIATPPDFDLARAPMRYEFPVDVALKKLKFNRKLQFAPPLASLLVPVIKQVFPACDVLVPVPLHRWRHVRRGFNQADELSNTLAKSTGLPVLLTTMRRRATRSQSGLDAAARTKNLRNAFVVEQLFRYRYPLIVDDVITTGATCNELAKALQYAGAHRVGALAIARSSGL